MNKFSSYLKKKKIVLKELIEKLSLGYDFASVLATDVKGKGIFVEPTSIFVRPSDISECGFVVRVYKNGLYLEYSFNEIDKNNVDEIILEIDKLASFKIKNEKLNPKCMSEDAIVKKFKRTMQGKEFKDEEVVEILKEKIKYGMSLNENTVTCRVRAEINEISKMYISTSKDLEQYYTWSNIMAFTMLRKDGVMKYGYDAYGSNNFEEALNRVDSMLKYTSDLASNLLNAKAVKPGVYTIITDPSITGLFAHEAFGHGLEMDQFVKERAVAMDYMQKKVARPILNMHDGAKATLSAASYFFDDEGALASDTKIIDKGVLVAGICDSVSGSILNYKPTGNGRRESYKRKAYTRMTNTFFEKGKDNLEDMIASVDYGFYISTTDNGMEDPKNWGIQCSALYGKEIKDGKFTGNYIAPVVMSGSVLDFLGSISMISKDFNVIGSGSCGKGYKEWVRVSDGGACLKAEVKIG